MGKDKIVKDKNSVKAAKNRTNTATKVALIVIAVVLVATLSLVFIQSSGIILRTNTVYESENFKVTGTMMQYMVNSQYQNFYSNYGAYLSSFGINSALSLRDQKFDPTNSFVSIFLGLTDEYKEFNGSWYDYFWAITEDQVESTLVFCEAAKKANVTLGDDEKKQIDDTIQAMYDDMDAINKSNREFYEKTYGQKNYITFGGIKDYLTAFYGQGVSVSDVRKTLELYHLSEKYYNQYSEQLLEDIKGDRDGIIAHFNSNSSDFNKADYLSFTFSASYVAPSDKANADKAWQTYITDVNEALDHAKALSECKTEEEFKTYMIKYWFEDKWQTQYDKTISELKKKDNEDKTGKVLTDADIPAKEVIEEKKNKVLADIIDGLLNNKKAEDLAPSGKTAFDGAIDAIRENLFNTLKGTAYYGGLEKLSQSFDDSTDEGKWIFAEDRKPGDNKYFASHTAKPKETTGASSGETTPVETPAESTPAATEGAAPAAETPAATTASTPAATTAETTPAPEPNWDVEIEKENTEDEDFTVQVIYITKPRYVVHDFVREFGHILISADGMMKNDKELSEEMADEEALKKAEELLKQVQALSPLNKDSFEPIAKENTEDSGVFYDEVAPNMMVPTVNDWLFAEERKAGDLEIVESDYGYHVMYLVSISEDEAWFVEAREDLYAEKLEAWAEQCKTDYKVENKSEFAKKNINLANG